MYLMIFCSNSAHFSETQLLCDLPTHGLKNGHMKRRTDGPTHEQTDGQTHLLIEIREGIISQNYNTLSRISLVSARFVLVFRKNGKKKKMKKTKMKWEK